MGENGVELRSVVWTEVFPFLRLFKTFKLAIHFTRLLLGLACVAGCYFGGRILDGIWLGAGAGVPVGSDAAQTEIDAYATRPAAEFKAWKSQVDDARRNTLASAALALGHADNMAVALHQTSTRPAAELTRSEKHTREIAEAREIIDQRLTAALAAVKESTSLSDDAKQKRRDTLRHAADYLRLLLAGQHVKSFGGLTDPMTALANLSADAQGLSAEQRNLLERVIRAQAALNELEHSRPRGPFIALLDYEMRCFAGAVQGVCSFRWGFAEPAHGGRPSLLGSVFSAGHGLLWLVTQRPWFALFYAAVHFVVFAFIGGAICRHAAVQAARDESIPLRETVRFAYDKFAGLIVAPLVPAGIFLLIAVVMWIGGLVAAIPWFGELAAGVLYGLALLGGFALAMILLATVLGLHLMWPTIAVEGSDAFDAVTHAVGYIGQRAWNAGFYTLLLLLYGGVSFVMVRVIGLLLFKLTHLLTGAGMSLFGFWNSSQTSTFAKLDAMWHMPAFGDLALLPTTDGTPFWGTFRNAPLSGSESVAAFLIACWVFAAVGLLGAFVVSFFFCGSTQMYFLLRRDVDAVDYDEIFFEEPEEAAPSPAPPPAAAAPAEAPASPPPASGESPAQT